jgi:type VII secretion protein EccCb
LSQKTFIDRPPRIEPELPSGEYPIPNPPDTEERAGELLAQAFLPMIMIVGYLFVFLMGQGQNMLLMIPMLLSVVASVVLVFYTRVQQEKQRKEMAVMYMRRLSELRHKMESEHEQQLIYYYYNYPNPEKVLEIAQDLSRNPAQRVEDIRSGTRLWERRPSDHDFMHFRLGISTRPSTVVYTASDNEKTDNVLTQEALRLANDSRLIFDVPVTVPLYQRSEDDDHKVKGPDDKVAEHNDDGNGAGRSVRHSVGITGPHDLVYSYMRTLLADFATFHSPDDTKLYIAGTGEARGHWRWAYALPHCKKADQTDTLCFEETKKPAENETDRMRLFWRELRTVLERRRMRLLDKEKESAGDVKLPFLMIVVDVLDQAPDWSCLKDLEVEATISTVLLDGQALGAAIFFLCSDRSKIPSRCSAVIEVDANNQKNSVVFRYAETGFNSARYVGYTTLVPTPDAAREFSRQLSSVDVRRGYGSSLASTVTLLEMLNLSSIENLQQLAAENWRHSKNPNVADWLQTAIGLLSGNEPRVLKFSAKADGVHGIIAGSTGSGKSELLMTLIIGLALNYDPSVLNFVLIDYKGGAAFEPFKRLPHKVDIVTNLDQSATARVFASIIAELDRRQKLNTYSNSKDIVHYRSKGLNLDPETQPYPHLFIIIDEFAEMIAGNAEYRSQLESITRLGRALGVTLILAAQRPAGVTDQMRANIKFRICLRVETPDDSREVLRRSDAAYLPPGIPGRGYLQIGNENVELIQTAYTGGDYNGPQDQKAVPNVIWPDRPSKGVLQKNNEPSKLYDVIVEMMENLAERESRPQWRPWPAALPIQVKPNMLVLETELDTAYMSEKDIELLRMFDGELIAGMALNEQARAIWDEEFVWSGIEWGRNAMRPLVGLIDNPYHASQKPLMIDFPNGHAAIFGASGRGKTTFLRTTIASLALTHSPDELHIYILDFGGRALSIFRDLPHVGAVIDTEEEERVTRLLRRIYDIIRDRQVAFSQARANNLDAYNLAHPDRPFPAILVVVDSFAQFREYYEGLMDALISLVREARAYGVHFLFAADVPGALTNKLMNLITERFTLKMTDPGEYSGIVGRGVPADLGNVPGRGFVRVDNLPLEFQTALAFMPDDNNNDDLENLGRMAVEMQNKWNNAWKGARPFTVEILPVRVSLQKLIQDAVAPVSPQLNILAGIDDRTLEPAWINMERQGPHLIIIGQPNSGKTTSLRTLFLSLAYRYSQEQFIAVLIDFNRKLWKGNDCSLADLPHVIQAVSEQDELPELLIDLRNELLDFEKNKHRRKVYIFIDNYDAFSSEAVRKNMEFFEELAVLVRRYQSAGVSIIASASIQMASSTDDLRPIIMAPSFGLALQSQDAVNRLNGRFPRSMAEVELPMGRGFLVRSGITSMLQIACPYDSNDDMESELDGWVERIRARHPGPRAQWLERPEPPPPAKVETPEPSPQPSAEETEAGEVYLLTPILSDEEAEAQFDIPQLRQLLLENMLAEDVVTALTPSDVVNYARTMNLLPFSDE